MDWNSVQYLKFERQRTQPSIDLAKRIEVSDPKRIVDIGCGPGNSTAVLKRFFPDATIIGADNSENMLGKAKANYPDFDFVFCDAEKDLSALGDGYDVVFSNACIQWIPDHPKLIPALFSLLKPGGVLAVQVPMTKGAPLFEIIDEITADPKWGFAELGLRVCTVLDTGDYFDILSGCSENFDLWETVYYHRMPDHEAMLEWIRGTRLRPFLRVLDKERAAEFEREIMERATPFYPPQENGEILFRFNRFFFTASR